MPHCAQVSQVGQFLDYKQCLSGKVLRTNECVSHSKFRDKLILLNDFSRQSSKHCPRPPMGETRTETPSKVSFLKFRTHFNYFLEHMSYLELG